jgi:NAD(P)-dependent dehydrogenase (short-subunit alcohol dehydrogenase family)
MGIPYQSFYAAAKFALEGLSESIRMELAPQNIGVVCVEPGNIRTDIGEHRLLCETQSVHYTKAFAAACDVINETVQDGGPPEEVAEVVYRVVRAKRPRLRYTAGKGAASTMLLFSILPYRIIEHIMRRYYRQ